MTDLGVLRWIRELGEAGAVALARGLVLAEAGRHGLPLDQFTMSGRIKVSDQGVDGRTHFPPEAPVLLPTGPQVWQVKSGSSSPSATTEFDADKHAGLLEAIRDGYDYTLFWANDPVDPTLQTVKDNFSAAVRAVRDDATVTFLFADSIERLCYAHLGVLVQQSPIPISGVVSLDVWAPTEFTAVPFQLDPDRARFIEVIRGHVATEDMQPEMHVYGDTGVGKSRLVYEALAVEGIGERVLVVPDASHWEPGLLTLTAQSNERSLIAVVDDCDAEDRKALGRYAGMANGRIRLVTIGSRSTREQPPADLRYIELLPLEASASKEIAASVGLAEAEADLVARYTEGYPGLALTLANAIRFGEANGTLIDRVRGHEEVGSVLSSLLPAEDVVPLGMLALFEKLGFEGDLAQELTVACETLGVDEGDLRAISDRELRRFVSTAGRFRRVTPRLFAVWLASQFMHDRRTSLSAALTGLPSSLRERIVDQMSDFAGDSLVEETLGEILGQNPFNSGALADVDEGAARLIHVAAVAAPDTAIATIERLMSGLTSDQLRVITAPRRELVWSLEILAWFDHLFDRAEDALLQLALAENETWANNATGILQGHFRVHLGGTGAPFDQRMGWARRALENGGQPVASILVGGLKHALDAHESRSSPYFGGRTAPAEWRPQEFEEEVAARESAWALLLSIGERYPDLGDEVARALASGLRTAMRRGLANRVLTDLREIPWVPSARAVLGDALSKSLKYDSPPEDLAREMDEVVAYLRGGTLKDQLDYVISLSPWQLSRSTDEDLSGRPGLVIEIATDLVAAGRREVLEAADQSRSGDRNTVGVLFQTIAEIGMDEVILGELEAMEPPPDAALLGFLAGFAKNSYPRWAEGVLHRWLTQPHARLVVAGVHLLPATDDLARLAIAAVDSGAVVPGELGRLLYGAWASRLGEETLLEILRRLRDTGADGDTEAALGILDQWLEAHAEDATSAQIREVGVELVRRSSAIPDSSSAMVGLYRSRVISSLELPLEDRAPLVLELFARLDSFPDDYDLEALDGITMESADTAADGVVELIIGDRADSLISMWLERGKLLSRIGRIGGHDAVIAEILQEDESRWPELVGHIEFGSDEPDPIAVALLSRSDRDELRGRAAYRFMYPASGWSGGEANLLRSARERAIRWLEGHPARDLFRSWLDELIELIDQRIEVVEQQEAEREL